MAAILQMTFFKYIFFNENHCVLFKISLNFVPKDPIDKFLIIGLGNSLAPKAIKLDFNVKLSLMVIH